MEREPFSTSPDPAFFYESNEHMTALMRVMLEIRLRRGLSVILGDVGTGKTTLCRKLLQMCSARGDVDFYIILDPSYETEHLFLDALLRTFGLIIDPINSNILDYKQELKDFLFRQGIESNKTVVLLIDEAQKLNGSSLEVLRTLLNYETNEFKLLQLVLVGQMELLSQLKEMKNFADRISLKYILNPLDDQEVREMITFRLQRAGYHAEIELFDRGAIEEIYKATSGYPRRVAMLCHKTLMEMVLLNRNYVDQELIHQLVSKEVLI